MADLTAKAVITLLGNYTNSLDLVIVKDIFDKSYTLELADGTGDDQGNIQWHDTRSLAASATENLDLAGSLVDAFGKTLTFAAVKALFIKNNSTGTQVLSVGGAASNVWSPFANTSDIITINPGGVLFMMDGTGWAVSGGTSDLLKIANAAGAALTYDILIWGDSA